MSSKDELTQITKEELDSIDLPVEYYEFPESLKEIYGIIIEGVKYINRKGGKKAANYDDF